MSALAVAIACSSPIFAHGESVPASYFQEKVQPLFNARCIACHSCFESPCQMNLQTYAGVKRGANLFGVYRADRLESMAPTRMFEDVATTEEWRKHGFFDVLEHGKKSIFWRLIAMADTRKVYPRETVRENLTCVKSERELIKLEKHQPEYAMPYALPALNQEEKQILETWLLAGAPGTPETLTLERLTPEQKKLVRSWEEYLNAKTLKARVIARYLFEHLFLAHFHFTGKTDNYLRLVRSKTPCGAAVTPVQARLPNSDPGVSEWSYCFYVDPAATIAKKHIPFEISAQKLNWIRANFEKEKWEATAFPSFKKEIAANPFVTFREIPTAARYRFLLEDARYHIMTFIKGPVCNGSIAVNVIQEQFYVLFMDPKADVMSTDPEFAQSTESLLQLPGNFEAQEGMLKAYTDWSTLTELRTKYRERKIRITEKKFPQGLKLTDVWNGDGKNPNALLTVFRHDDNAEVVVGAKGDLPKTVFLLDYSVFERLVYNLVVNFDVFGDIKHQALTRLYMDLIRMEAENNYLDFLPPQERLKLKKDWYRGTMTQLRLNILNEDQFPQIPAAIKFDGSASIHHQMIDKILHERLDGKTRGEVDLLNWKKLKLPEVSLSPERSQLRELTSRSVKDGKYFAKLFPEFSILALSQNGKIEKLYSIIRNREKENISWMFAESLRLDGNADTLTILDGVKGSYPNEIFVIEARDLESFKNDTLKLSMKRDFEVFQKKYALSRRDPKFWAHFDRIQEVNRQADPLDAGHLDLSRLRIDLGAQVGSH
jgi:hypothetical protein